MTAPLAAVAAVLYAPINLVYPAMGHLVITKAFVIIILGGMGAASAVIRHGPLEYDQSGHVAHIDGKLIDLSARELGLLEVLLQRSGRLVSKEQLVERLCEWGEEVSHNAIEVYIHRLRKKIEQGPIRIATVRGLGYCLEKIQG